MLRNYIDKKFFDKINNVVCIYLFATIAVLFIGRVIPLKNIVGANIEGLLYDLLAIIGVGLLVLDFFTSNMWKKTRYVWILYLFIGVMGISSILNVKFGYIDNLKTMIWTTIQFGIFYTFYKRFGKEQLNRILWGLWKTVSIFWCIPVCYSLWQFLSLKGKWIETYDGRLVRQGFIENRLFGVFNDPNYAAVTSLCVVVAMLFLFKEARKKRYKFLIILNIIMQCEYIVLSGSRTALVCSIVACCIYGWEKILISIKKAQMMKKIAVFLAVPIFSVGIIVGMNVIVKNICELEMKIYTKISGQDGYETSLIEREDTDTENISNNRTAIWKAYLEGLEGDELFGGSPRNYLKKWIEKNPKGYLAETSYEIHNGYLAVLMGTGIVGLLTIFIYLVLCTIKTLKYVICNEMLEKEFVFSSVIICILLAYVFFFTELFFVHNITSVFFWLHCGSMMSFFEKLE